MGAGGGGIPELVLPESTVIFLENDTGVITGTGPNVTAWVDQINSAVFANAADNSTCPTLETNALGSHTALHFTRASTQRLLETTQAGSLWPFGLYPAYVMALVNPDTATVGTANGQAIFSISGGNSPGAASGMMCEVASFSASWPCSAAVRSVQTNGTGNLLQTAETTEEVRVDEWQSVEGGVLVEGGAGQVRVGRNTLRGPSGSHLLCGNTINVMGVGCYVWSQSVIWNADMSILSILAFNDDPTAEVTENVREYWEAKYGFTLPDGTI